MSKRLWSWLFLIAAVVVACAGVWSARHPFTVLTKWKPADGTIIGREVLRNHDGDGDLYFQMKGTFRYMVDGAERTSSAVSYFGSPEFGWIAERALRYQSGERVPLRYDPANPDVFEFGTGFNRAYFGVPLRYFGLASFCLLIGVVLQRMNAPKPLCSQCSSELKRYYRYCPECGETAGSAVPENQKL